MRVGPPWLRGPPLPWKEAPPRPAAPPIGRRACAADSISWMDVGLRSEAVPTGHAEPAAPPAAPPPPATVPKEKGNEKGFTLEDLEELELFKAL